MKVLLFDNIDYTSEFTALNDITLCLRHVEDLPDLEFRVVVMNSQEVLEEDFEWADKIHFSGSSRNIGDDIHWMPKLERALELAIESGKPVFSSCFVTQLLATQLGVNVVKNPNGVEFGPVKISLTEAGKVHPYLAGFDGKVLASHVDYIESKPEGGELLAYNNNSPVQAFVYKNVFAAQFHADMPTETQAKLLKVRREKYIEAGLDVEKIAEELEEGRFGHEIFGRFLRG